MNGMNLSPWFKPELGDVLAPEDIIAHKVRNLLAADDRLRAIFANGDRIETVPFLAGIDRRDYPRLYVAAFSATEDQGVTDNDMAKIRVYVRVAYEAKDWQPLYGGATESLVYPFGVPSLATLARHIVKVLKQDTTLETVMPNGSTAGLARAALFGPYSFSTDAIDPNANRWAFNHDIQVEYDVRVIHADLANDGADAGKIHNVAANGG